MSRELKTFSYDTPEYHQALQLRNKILRNPLGLQFTEAELKKDEQDIHFGLFEDGKIIACLTLTENKNGMMKMRQVAVEDTAQGKGIGSVLAIAAEKIAKENGYHTMFCHARKAASDFYLKLGYNIIGDEFTEVNIPHYLMEKKLI